METFKKKCIPQKELYNLRDREVTGPLVGEDEGLVDSAFTVSLSRSFSNTVMGVQVMV